MRPVTHNRAAPPPFRAARGLPCNPIFCALVVLSLAACVGRQTASPSPAAVETTFKSPPNPRSARLVFVGDVMSHTPQVSSAAAAARVKGRGGHDYTEVFAHFSPIFEAADIAVANLETTLRTSPPYSGYPCFAAPAELAFALRRAGVGIVTTANNHICDRGAAGIRSTLTILDSAGIRHTGAFLDSTDRARRNPLRFTASGLRFALLAYTYGTNGIPVPKGMMVNLIDTAVIARDIALARSEGPDCVVVAYHWGEEYRVESTRGQRRLAEWTHALGADIIIGHHPHVVQPMESGDSMRGAPTYFSLGNFVSNQRGNGTDSGLAAEITVTRTEPPVSLRLPDYLTPTAAIELSFAPTAADSTKAAARCGKLAAALTGEPVVTFEAGWRLSKVRISWSGGRYHYEVLPAGSGL